jgi:isochorismate synthase EntC
MVRRDRAVQQRLDGGQKIVGHRAAETAIGEFHHVVLAAALDAATQQQFPVDAEIAELVDQEGEAPTVIVFDHMADQAGLAGAEKSGDDGRGNACGHGFNPLM